jgi:hypothetical protein
LLPCIPNLSSTSYIEITGDIEFIQWLVPKRVWGDKTHTILHKKNVRYIRHDIGYDIGYDIICDVRYDMVFFLAQQVEQLFLVAQQVEQLF